MQVSNLPTSLAHWKRYINQAFKIIEDTTSVISFGQHKVEIIIYNLNKFRQNLFKKPSTYITPKTSKILFNFLHTCAAFISFISQYQEDNFLSYLIDHNLNYQYQELAKLWHSWNSQASSLLIESFEDITCLNFANSQDLKVIRKAIFHVISSSKLPVPITNILNRKLDSINQILSKIELVESLPTPNIITRSQFEKIKDIGKGAYAVVILAKMLPDGQEVAVKELKNVQLNYRNLLSLKRELNSLLQLEHPNILQFIGVTVTPPFCIATAFLNNRSLFENLRGGPPLTPFQEQKIAVGMARGLEYLDAMRFIHRDFKSQNVLLDDKYNAVICDFGISRQIGPKMTCELGTAQWTAPEVLVTDKNAPNYDNSADTYSYSIVLWEMIAKKLPFQGMYPVQAVFHVLTKGARPEFPTGDQAPPAPLKKLIEQCWSQDPRKRPKMSVVRKALEDCKAVFKGIDDPMDFVNNERKSGDSDDDSSDEKPVTYRDAFLKWVEETKPEHERIMKIALDSAEREEKALIEKLHTLNPLDSSATKLLQHLYSIDYPLSLQLFQDILRLSNQTLSISVQDIAFDIMKQILSRDDITDISDPEEIIDALIVMMEEQPLFVITAIKLIAGKIKDVNHIVEKFLKMTQSHATLDIIQIILSQNKDRIDAALAIHVFESFHGQFSITFYRFIMNVFGARKEFLPLACRTLVYLSLYVKGLGKLCQSDFDYVKSILNFKEIEKESRASLQQALDSISICCTDSDSTINETMGLIMLKMLVPKCFEYNTTDPILPLLCYCATIDSLQEPIMQISGLWDLIQKALDENIQHEEKIQKNTSTVSIFSMLSSSLSKSNLLDPSKGILNYQNTTENNVRYINYRSALTLIETLPIVENPEIRNHIWTQLMKSFTPKYDRFAAKTIGSLLNRSKEFSTVELIPTILEVLSQSRNYDIVLTCLELLYSFDKDSFKNLIDGNFLNLLINIMSLDNSDINLCIGQLLYKISESGIDEIPFEVNLFSSILVYLYDPKTSHFDDAEPFIRFLCVACKSRKVLFFLQKRYFVKYIEQLPWRYPNSQKVPEVIQFCAETLTKYYPLTRYVD